jgi:hypothetical protein
VRFAVHIWGFATPELLKPIDVLVNQKPVVSTLAWATGSDSYVLSFVAPLLKSRATVVEFRLPSVPVADFAGTDARGFCLLGTEIQLASVEPAEAVPSEVVVAMADMSMAAGSDVAFGEDILRARAERAVAERREINDLR